MSGEHNFKLFADKHSTEEIAKVTGYHPSTVYAYKKGKAIPSDFLIQLADHYKTSTDKILGRVLPAEALTAENFPTVRPNVAFTVSETQLDHAKENRELKFNLEMLKKQNAELNEKIAIYVRRVAEFDEIHRKQSAELKTLQMPSPGQILITEDAVNALQTEIKRLKAMLQTIHYLSEEK